MDILLQNLVREAPWERARVKAIFDLLRELEGSAKREHRRSFFKHAISARIEELGPRPHGASEPPDITNMRCRASKCTHCPRIRRFFQVENSVDTLNIYAEGGVSYKHVRHQLTTHLEATLATCAPVKHMKHSVHVCLLPGYVWRSILTGVAQITKVKTPVLEWLQGREELVSVLSVCTDSELELEGILGRVGYLNAKRTLGLQDLRETP